MNYNSCINEVLDLKPIINERNNSIFFYNHNEEDNKVINDALKSSLVNNFWTWTRPNGLDILSNGFRFVDRNDYLDVLPDGFRFVDRNAYVITNYTYHEKTDFSFRVLPSDFEKIRNYEEGLL